MSETRHRLDEIVLDEQSLAPASANAEHERRIALFDLNESNSFTVLGSEERGPYFLRLSHSDGRLVFEIGDAARAPLCVHQLPMANLRKTIKDYLLICESYQGAIRAATPSQIEAIDMGRRGLHNEAAEMLMEALAAHFTFDLETARRLFTLVCAMHVRS
jgi:uncharacterized protein (UPF0262 family)